ncbi:hypothetical protein K493DRAFT_312125 [Basidiobolus meristosporus CBS 931.73]|uniref:RAVE subunit 2/Rogdi n=1 Tax=Basidiobolus meristosporus CBS 931.73 TaxID=1314790 RepID=A0A1Y1YW10_9FUNG|nr:hypothetical protein K493DRAFT_312125 [Basidiobolus meristosporus CBS 931.73]|eukprot:ORY02220.1 hypothetical protein K493DRAFT_312125 [Basidiobolus meristosporus CBS 931.73]
MYYNKQESLSTALHKEEKCLSRELEWLLDTQLEPTLQLIKEHLEKAREVRVAASEVDTPVNTLALSSTNSDALKGFVKISGFQLRRADLQIRLPGFNKGHLFQCSLQPTKPYTLEQIQTSYNYLELAWEELEFGRFPRYKDAVKNHLESILDLINKGIESLNRLDEEKLFPNRVCDPKMFQPELPSDIVVQFYIKGSAVVANALIIQLHQSMPSSTGILRKKNTHKINEFKGMYAEITGEITVETHCPSLAIALNGLTQAANTCHEFLTKLSMFE